MVHVFWLQPWKVFNLTEEQLGILASVIRQAFVVDDFEGAQFHLLDTSADGEDGQRTPQVFGFDDLPILAEDALKAAFDRFAVPTTPSWRRASRSPGVPGQTSRSRVYSTNPRALAVSPPALSLVTLYNFSEAFGLSERLGSIGLSDTVQCDAVAQLDGFLGELGIQLVQAQDPPNEWNGPKQCECSKESRGADKQCREVQWADALNLRYHYGPVCDLTDDEARYTQEVQGQKKDPEDHLTP